jgi:hypothetical protein
LGFLSRGTRGCDHRDVKRPDQNCDSLDPLAVGIATNCGTSASQHRSTFMMAVDVGPELTGQDELSPGQSAFISAARVPSPNF